MVALYGKEISFNLQHYKPESFMSPVLKGILKLHEWSKLGSLLTSPNFTWMLNSGAQILFWHDHDTH